MVTDASEIERLTSNSKVRRPRPIRDRWGRWHRDPAGEYDWLYSLSDADRTYIARNFMSEAGVEVDVLASLAGMDVEDWAQALVEAARSARSRRLYSTDPLSDDFGELTDYDDRDVKAEEILGPVEVAALLGVKPNTIAVWRRRFPDFPQPFLIVSSTRLWRRGEIEAWAEATGR